MIHRMAAGLLVLICTAAQAVDSRFELLLDLDGNASTGCTVTTPAGNFAGVETILTTHVQTEGLDQAEVVLVERQDCANPETDTFGPTETVSTDGWPVGIGNGVDGFNVIETSMALGQSNRFLDIRLAVVATDELGNVSVLLEQSPGGGPITLEGFDSLPVDFAGRVALGLLAAMLLVIGLVVMSRRGRLTLTAVALLSAGGVAGAACLLDGEIFDWSNDDQVATTGAMDSTSGVDIRAVFAKRSDGHSQLCVRIDAALVFPDTLVATLSVSPSELEFIEDETGEITVTNDAGSPVAAENVVATIPGGSDISVQGTTCGASLAVGDSCQITFTAPAPEGPTDIVIAGSNTSTETVAVTVEPTPVATLNVNPTTLEFIENESGEVTVTNDAGSPVAAENVVATIPGGSDFSVQGTTCGASLAVGDSCQITFTAPAPEGPTDIVIAGSNTNTVLVAVTVNPLQFTVTPSAGANGSISPATAQVVNAGSSLTFEATPDTGFAVNQWRLDGDLVQTGGTSFQLNNIQANHAVQVTFDQTTLSPLTQNLALSVNDAGADPALIGNARIIRIANTGVMPASNVQVSTAGFPAGTSITSNACTGTLNAGDACDITVTPGSSASPDVAANACTTAPGTEPVPTTVSVTADNASSTNINVLILGYGCIYQGGYLFAVDDSTPNTTSIGGKVAALSDQSTGVRWGPLETVGGISETSTAAPDACNGSGDGQCNTSRIIAAALVPPVAAQLCEDSSDGGFTDWYLPAICEAGRFVGLGSDAGCGTTNPNLYTTLHTNNLGGFASGFYWSSTEFSANPMVSAWLQSLDIGAQGADNKSNAIRVRCVRAF